MSAPQLLPLLRRLLPQLLERRKPQAVALALIAAVCVGGAAYWNWSWGATLEPILEGREFRRAELQSLAIALAAANLDDWVCRDRQVLVPRRRRGEYLKAIDKAGALPPRLAGPALPPGSSLLDTRDARERKQRQADELAYVRVIEAMRGVEEATVKLSSRTVGGLHRQVERCALVAVRATDDRLLDPDQTEAIRQVVVGGDVGLTPADVTITDLNRSSAPREMPVAGADRVASARERQLREQIAAHLSALEGLQVSSVAIDSPPPSCPAPATRPAVGVRDAGAAVVRLSLPRQTLSRHFAERGAELTPVALTQRAAARLKPLVQQLACCPTAVEVALSDAAVMTSVQSDSHELPRAHSDNELNPPADSAGLPDNALLWVFGLAAAGLVSLLARPRIRAAAAPAAADPAESGAQAFAESVREQPQALADLLQRWSDGDAEPDSPSVSAP